ncbi:MAG: hypothetical protein ACYCXQ_05990 [Candidatus Humimicrobiaceae bacterium]
MEEDRMREDYEGHDPGPANAPKSYGKDLRNKSNSYRNPRADSEEEIYEGKRGRRAFAHVWNIIWSLVLIIFFNFYSSYIAYFQYEQSNNTLVWHKFTILTQDFQKIIPLITAGLIIITAGSIILLILDKYILARVVELISAIFAIAVLGNILIMFPFDFNIIPYEKVAQLLPLILKIVLGIIILILIVQIISNFVKIVVKIAKK